MLKLGRSSSILLMILTGTVLFIMACDYEDPQPSMGCGGVEEAKEIIVTLPSAEEAGGKIDKYKIEINNLYTSEKLQQIEGLPGESKAVTVLGTEDPLMIKAIAFDQAGNEIAVGESTEAFSMAHDGLLCDMEFGIDFDKTSSSPIDATIDIRIDCHLIDVIEKMTEIVDDAVHDVIDVSKYIIHDTLEDFFEIIDIIR